MKIVRIFTSSTVKSMQEEKEIVASFLQMMNTKLKRFNIYFKLDFINYEEVAFGEVPSSDIINKVIAESQVALFLIHTDMDVWSEKEFELAYEWFKSINNPRIVVLFKASQFENISDTAKRFEEKIRTELNHYYSLFEMEDQLKWRLLIELTLNMPELALDISQGNCSINKIALEDIDIKKTPFYANHQRLNALQDEYKKFEDIFSNPTVDMESILKANDKMNEIDNEIIEIEKSIVKLFQEIYDSAGKHQMTPLLRRASVFLERGDIETASKILNTRSVIEQCKKTEDIVKAQMEDSIKKLQNEVNTIQASINTQLQTENENRFEEADILYQQAIRLEKTYHLTYKIHWNYAWFLLNQKRYQDAENIVFEINEWSELPGNQNIEDDIEILRLISICRKGMYKYSSAIDFLSKAIEIEDKRFDVSNENNTYELAKLYESIANIYHLIKDWDNAKNSYIKERDLYVILSKNDERYIVDLGANYHSYADLLKSMEYIDEAIIWYKKAIDLYEGNKRYDEERINFLKADIYVSLANIYMNNKQLSEVEDLLNKSCEIYEQGYLKNPVQHGKSYSNILIDFAYYYNKRNQEEESRSYFFKGLDIKKKLFQTNSLAFGESYFYSILYFTDLFAKKYGQECRNLCDEALDIIDLLEDNEEVNYSMWIAYAKKVIKNNYDLGYSDSFINKLVKCSNSAHEFLAKYYFEKYGNNLANQLVADCFRHPESEQYQMIKRALKIKTDLIKLENCSYIDNISRLYHELTETTYYDIEMTDNDKESILLEGFELLSEIASRNKTYQTQLIEIIEHICFHYKVCKLHDKLVIWIDKLLNECNVLLEIDRERYLSFYVDKYENILMYYTDDTDIDNNHRYALKIIKTYDELIEKHAESYKRNKLSFYERISEKFKHNIDLFLYYFQPYLEVVKKDFDKDSKSILNNDALARGYAQLARVYRLNNIPTQSVRFILMALEIRVNMYHHLLSIESEAIITIKNLESEIHYLISTVLDKILYYFPAHNLRKLFEQYRDSNDWYNKYDRLKIDVENALENFEKIE